MGKAPKKAQQSAPRIIESGANWSITRTPGAMDYDAYITDRGYIGSRPTPTQARMLIAEYNNPEVK